jgi:hypothetical protein
VQITSRDEERRTKAEKKACPERNRQRECQNPAVDSGLPLLCSFTFSILFVFGVTPECFQTQNSPQQTFAGNPGGNQTNSRGQFQKSIARPKSLS